MRGIFITFEGVDGCGKTTQTEMVVRALAAEGYDPIYTREPGGTPVGERMRPLLLSNSSSGLAPLTELLLLAAARAQHVAEVIRPGLEAGHIVLSDRYVDSTVAFQGYGRGLDMSTIDELNRLATGGLLPDLTLLFDLDVAVARGRLDARPARAVEPARNRFDEEDLDFHQRVRQGYLALAAKAPGRIRVVDASGTAEEAHLAAMALIRPLLERVADKR